MTNDFAADVLICGAGAAGLTLAIDLARRGVSFRFIETLDDPFRGSRGKGIQPRTQEVFEDLGILDRIVSVGGLYPKQREYRDDGSYCDTDVVQSEPATPAEPYQLPLMVPQFLTERVMRERLAEFGRSPEYGTELVAFEQDAQGVTARLAGKSGEETIRVNWLVGTDGGRSFVRHALGIDFPGKTLGARHRRGCYPFRSCARCLASLRRGRHAAPDFRLPAGRNRTVPASGAYPAGR